MANNIQNLRPCTPENARERQLKSAKKKHENAVKRDLIFKMFQKRLLGKKTVSENDIVSLGDDAEGYEIGKKAVRALLDLDIIRETAKKTGNVRGYIELMKFAGVHFDQSAEALGGAENPLNVNQATTITADRVRQISDALEEEC
ncbi:MAG: hypothetical protein MJY89_06305 [Bacteroidales bacterium]|nr:hypothetical protein [Bacteroidales bacterium]